MIKLKLIVCCDKNNGIGKNGKLPWNIRSEMKLFKEKTIGNGNNCVIMGKNTYLSIPEKYCPLKERINCVLTSNIDFKPLDVMVFQNMKELELWIQQSDYDEYWIIGGELLYSTMIYTYKHWIDEIHLSKLNNDYDCDTFFPVDIIQNEFQLKSCIQHDEFQHMIFNQLSK